MAEQHRAETPLWLLAIERDATLANLLWHEL
jgi:hypothetical protein